MVYVKRQAGRIVIASTIVVVVFMAPGLARGIQQEGSMTLFNGTDFKGKPTTLNIKGIKPNSLQSLKETDAYHRMSSIRWSLPTGVVVVFYRDKERKGDRMTIWGKGDLSQLFDRRFNNDAGYWEWTKIGK